MLSTLNASPPLQTASSVIAGAEGNYQDDRSTQQACS